MKTKKDAIILIVCIAVLLAVCSGYLIINRMNTNSEKETAQYFGGDVVDKPKWQTMADKTVELQAGFENEVKAEYDVTITKNEQVDENYPVSYTIITTDTAEIKDIEKFLLKTYIKYRDKGYKGRWYLFLNDKYIQSFPPTPKI